MCCPRADALSSTFAALADPTRRSILSRLAEGEATVNELAEPLPTSLPAERRRTWEQRMDRLDTHLRGQGAPK